LRDPARELDDLEAALHLAGRVGEHLAVLVGDGRGQFVPTAVHELPEREEDPGPPGQRGLRPVLERGRSSRHHTVDVGLLGEEDLGLLLTRGRVEHRADARGPTPRGRAVDPVLDGPHSCAPSSSGVVVLGLRGSR
jgi:hypothetical protein